MGACLIFDTELTDRENGEIIEAAYLRLRPYQGLLGPEDDHIPALLQIEEVFVQRYKPSKQTSFGALSVHHILPAELDCMPPSSEFSLPADAAYVIGHMIDTDWMAAGSPAHIQRIDTCALAKHIWPAADAYSQSALLYRLMGPTPQTRDRLMNAHSAFVDVQNNLTLLDYILAELPQIKTWSALHAHSEECRIPLTCPFKRWEGVKLEDMDEGAVSWCLRQDFIDDYFRKGLERVVAKRRAAFSW